MGDSDVTTQVIFGVLSIIVALAGVLFAYRNRSCELTI